jgi:hypothetical protein
MKKNILVMAALLAGLAFTACSGDASELEKAADEMKKEMTDAVDEATEEAKDKVEAEVEAEAEAESTSSVLYQCPDDCENGPAYPKAGPCKICKKPMVVI